MCTEDLNINMPSTQLPTNNVINNTPSPTEYCGSIPLSDADKSDHTFFNEICLSGIEDQALAGVYKLNGSYHGYPAYIKDYLPSEDKPYVYIKYEDVIIGDINGDGIIDKKKTMDNL